MRMRFRYGVTNIWRGWTTPQNVIEFQREDYERAYLPDAARAILSRWDDVCAHYEITENYGHP
jgi:hypothetical protein